jgi:hypothetical protein
MVIGNILTTRHSKVWVLSPPTDEFRSNNKSENLQQPSPANGTGNSSVQDWPFQEISRPQQQYAAGDAQDSLESAIIDVVVQSHFEYISFQGYEEGSSAGIEAAMQRQNDLQEKKRQLRRQALVRNIQEHAMTVAGAVIAVLVSTTISSVLQQRAANSRR